MINDKQETIDLKLSLEAFRLLEIIVTEQIRKAPTEGNSDGKATARIFEKHFKYPSAIEGLSAYMPCAVTNTEFIEDDKKVLGYSVHLEKNEELLKIGYIAPFTHNLLAVWSMLVNHKITTLKKKRISKQFRDMKDKFYFSDLLKEIILFTQDPSIISTDNPNKKIFTSKYVFDLDKLSRLYQSLYANIYNRNNVKTDSL